MSNEILDAIHAAREKLWERAGGTMRGFGEYLMECERRAKARGVKWLDSEEEKEAIGAEVRARLAAEEQGVACVLEGRAGYGAGDVVAGGAATSRTLRGEGRRGGGGEDFGAKEAPAEREGSR